MGQRVEVVRQFSPITEQFDSQMTSAVVEPLQRRLEQAKFIGRVVAHPRRHRCELGG